MSREDDYVEELKKLILEQIDKTQYAVFLFGGRAKGHRGKAVDVDVGFLGNTYLPLECVGNLYSAIEESFIPFKVDLVDFYKVDKEFRTIALEDIIIWNQPSTIKIN